MPAKEQDVTISIKAKLYPDQNTIEEFKKPTTAYSEAATWLSDLMFNDFSSPEMITDCRTLHDKYYYDIRQTEERHEVTACRKSHQIRIRKVQGY